MIEGRARLVTLLAIAGGLGSAGALGAEDTDLSISHKLVSPTASALGATYDLGETKLDTTAIASLASTGAPGVMRLESAWTGDFGGAARLKVGDSVSNPGAWGSAVRFAGLQVGTPFAMRSDVITSSSRALPGVAVLPNRSDTMFAGAHAIASGQLVNYSPTLLPKPALAPLGCGNYSMSVGRVREDYALAAASYGPLFANSTVTCGLQPSTAVEAQGEYLKGDTGVASLNLTQRVNSLVAASVGVAGSEAETLRGYQLRMGVTRTSEHLELDLRGRMQSEGYRDLSADPMQEIVAQRLQASVAAKLSPRAKLGVAYAMQRSHDFERLDMLALSQTIAFDRRSALSIVANRAVNDRSNSSLNLSFVRKGSY